ncbi:MAG TPA: DUF6541 family protein [Pseudonocardiaceae bacterium]
MSWLEAVPVALVGLAWLMVPGLLATYGIGLRGIAAMATAPIVGIALPASLGVVFGLLGVSWSLPVVLVVSLLVGLVVAGIGFLLRHRAPARAADPRSVTSAAMLGLLPALVLGCLIMVLGLHRPDELSQTYDAVYHYNAVRLILDIHNGNSLIMGTLATPGLAHVFYPAAWHDLTSLVVLSTGTSIPVAANMFSAAAALVVWPLSCILLARQIFGRSRLALGLTGLFSFGFSAFPWGLLGFGILWPNMLAMSIAPAGLAVIISILGLVDDDPIGRGRAWLLLPVVVAAGVLAQTNVLFTWAALALVPIAFAMGRRTLALSRRGRLWRGIVEIVVVLVVAFGFWWFVATTPLLAAVRTLDWPPFESPAQAVGQVALNAASGPDFTNGFVALWVLSALVLIGVAMCRRQVALRWVVGCYVICAALYVVCAAINRPDTQKFTGYWYNDAYRLAAMLPITTVPLAVAGTIFLIGKVRVLLDRSDRIFVGRRVARTGLSAVIVLLLVLVGTKGLYAQSHVNTLSFRREGSLDGFNGEGWFVNPAEQAFFARIKNDIPAGELVADNPWDGSALLWAFADRRTLFPHLSIPMTAAQTVIYAHLDDVATDPAVCPAVQQTHVGYLLIGNGRIGHSPNTYPGLVDPGNKPGFQLIDSEGVMKLYRITGCGE